MYNKFFAFKEKPFKLVPNPEYLFLSKSHEEALSHLTYAISHGDGFVEITGEVGTGKTTMCRVFLENLDNTVDAAYIFNPKLDALQLLKAINDEFGIDSKADNTKDLIDRLNIFLIEKKAAGQKVLVLIDEAQNLSLEVLEQLRLLSNLETTQEKLLQIILVGQPELGDMLSSHKLRQLGQRITINCQLSPLTFQETKDYIRHRISLASHRAGPPFDKTSYRAIYDFSKGIPRLINIACDRILLNAFSRNSFKISGPIAKEAIKELRQKRTEPSREKAQGTTGVVIVVSAFIITLAVITFSIFKDRSPEIPAAGKALVSEAHDDENYNETAPEQPGPLSPDETEPAIDEKKASAASPQREFPKSDSNQEPVALAEIQKQKILPEPEPAKLLGLPEIDNILQNPDSGIITQVNQTLLHQDDRNFINHLQNLKSRNSRNSSMEQTLKVWFPAEEMPRLKTRTESDPFFFQQAAKKRGLLTQPVATDSDLTLIQNLNLPVIFTFYLPGHSWPKYLAVPYMSKEKIYYVIDDQGTVAPVSIDIFLKYWSGEAYIIWKNFNELKGIITERTTGHEVQSLKKLLQQLGYENILIDGIYDTDTIEIVKAIQEKYGLYVDGDVGPYTKIALYNESLEFTKPSLAGFADAGKENGS